MCRSDITNLKRTTAGIIGLLMLVSVLFSAFYISAEADHVCVGENCPICVCIHQCENTLRQICDRSSFQPAILVPAILVLVHAFLFTDSFSNETLVSNKVRLND